MKNFSCLSCILLTSIFLCTAQTTYDIVLRGGTVMDPESGLSAKRNVGISGNKIKEISSEELTADRIIDVSGLIVAPGFIDLHVHGMTNAAHEYQVMDGVTTALELEGGRTFLREWLNSKAGNSIVNYGASVPHGAVRAMAMGDYEKFNNQARRIIEEEGFESPNLMKLVINMGRGAYTSLTPDQIKIMTEIVRDELTAGALGIGVPVGYYPGASAAEIFEIYHEAAALGAPIFSHTRGFGMPGINEAIANAAVTGASLHIVHANSLSLGDIDVTLAMVEAAQKNNVDVSTELYPYTAASTSLESALFDDDWQADLNISYEDLQWEATGERLTEETFNTYRKEGGIVIIHMMEPEWIKRGIAHPITSIGSDGMPYAPGAHPRTAGTFSRVLGKYVREENVITLMEALRKMTIMPAQRLEKIAPMMRQKGRIQVGADADITVFNPNTITDKATFKELAFSEGVEYVLINGVLIVENGACKKDVFPGEAIISKFRN